MAEERVSATARRAHAGGAESGVRVLCADDHAMLIEGLKAQFAIDGGIRVVGSLSSAEGLLEEVARLNPDVVLLDIEMPGPDVFETADRLHRAHPSLPFVFLSAHIRDGYLAAAYKCGASGYFAKADELEDIVAGVRALAQRRGGAFVMGPKVKRRFAQAGAGGVAGAAPGARASEGRGERESKSASGSVRTPLETLTAREVEVLRLIGKGLSRVEIAAELSRSAKTIDGHQERLLRKLGVESRADLMRFAIREGLAEA